MEATMQRNMELIGSFVWTELQSLSWTEWLLVAASVLLLWLFRRMQTSRRKYEATILALKEELATVQQKHDAEVRWRSAGCSRGAPSPPMPPRFLFRCSRWCSWCYAW